MVPVVEAVTTSADRVRAASGVDSSESANPTGTITAATIAASNNTRYRFRMCLVLFTDLGPQILVIVEAPRQVDRGARH